MVDKYDCYKEAEELIKILHLSSCLKHYSETLQAAIDGGSTGTEIFMALRWNLKKLLKEKSCEGLVRDKSKKLLEELNKALC